MTRIRRSATGAAVSGALAVFAALTPADAAEPTVGAFEVGTIWKGAARFASAGEFMRCGMEAKFPEGLELYFALDSKGVLGLDVYGPDDMDVPKGKVPVTLGTDGRVLRALEMNVDETALELQELWLYADLKPASEYLPALKKSKTITVAIAGQTTGKPQKDKTWTYTAALTGGAQAFQALEACVAKYAGTSRPAPSPATAPAPGGATAGGAVGGPTKGAAGVTKKAASFGAIAVGEDGGALITGISSNKPSLEEAAMAAVEACEREGGSCQVRATMDRATPCGAVAGGDDADGDPIYGWGTGGMKAEAELGAMQACSASAFGCQITLSRCLSE